MNRYCLVMPVYNHERRLPELIARLAPYNLRCYLVDDGSDDICKEVIANLVSKHAFLRLITLPENSGKGVAVTTGLKAASDDGFTHAIQIDSDGQHSPAHLPEFIARSEIHPGRIVSGFRPYESMPDGRRKGRRLTDFWVHINTLSGAIKDSMCGYRTYPLAPTLRLLGETQVGRRMDFDTDIIVRLYWAGVEVTHIEVSVVYDEDMPSHFAMVADNFRITVMHIKHFFGMLPRIPGLLMRRRNS